MEKIFLLSALSLASLSPLSCLANTASLNQYNLIHCVPVAAGRTVTEYKNESAFTVVLDNGKLFSWGRTHLWGDENILAPVVPEGRSVKEIFSSQNAFTALLDNGTILCWGDSNRGGTAPFIAPERQVISIASNEIGFVAILDNGKVVSWGDLDLPQTLLDAEGQGKQVISITSSCEAFATVVVDPATSQQTIISWGKDMNFFPSTTEREFNATLEIPSDKKVVSIAAADLAFTALFKDGTIQSWGNQECGGKTPQLSSDKKVVSIAAAEFAFTALFEDGTIQSWGWSQQGGKTPTLPAGATVTKIFANAGDFAALLSGGDNDGNILSWGAFSTNDVFSGNSKIITAVGPSVWHYIGWKWVAPAHSSVKSVVANGASFAAILDDGSVIAWGSLDCGGTTPSLPAGKQVVSITPCSTSFIALFSTPPCLAGFTALFADGTIQVWGSFGDLVCGEKTPIKMPASRRVVALTSDCMTYMALLDDGSLFSWGGDSLDSQYIDGHLISLPKGTHVLWMASPFEKYVLKERLSQ